MSRIEEKLIEEELKKSSGNISRVARVLGIDYWALKQKMDAGKTGTAQFIPAYGPEPEDIRTLGRPGFQQFVIAVKKAGQNWPAKYDQQLKDARQKFDDGTHEMFQTANKGWVVQYLIPRTTPAGRRSFFKEIRFE